MRRLRPRRCDVAIVGSGFAGSLAARVLRRLGRSVCLLERDRHPRFALGESSTPLAALTLRRLAERYDLPDLLPLAAYGRWLATCRELRRGLKRGFSFYGHQPGRRLFGDDHGERRLLVAASPNDELADTHWLRADLDAFLAARAQEEGVELLEATEVTSLEVGPEGSTLGLVQGDRAVELTADFLIDASGGQLFPRLQPRLARPRKCKTASSLLFSHFAAVRDLEEVAREEGVIPPPGPYPEDRAAVHHLVDVGWVYVLPFDHGIASVGVSIDPHRPRSGRLRQLAAARPAEAFAELAARHPSLGAQLRHAQPLFPVAYRPFVQHRQSLAAGPGWLALPSAYAFLDPLFSTGIAWSLTGVERVGRLFEHDERPTPESLERYAQLLSQETDHQDRLIAGAYRAMVDFRLFTGWAMQYFAAASWGETVRRLLPEARDWAWEGFLGCEDEALTTTLTQAEAALDAALAHSGPSAEQAAAFEAAITQAIAPRNVAGLADPERENRYPADVETVIESAAKLGLTRDEVEARRDWLLR